MGFQFRRKGVLFVISAPSGCGKTTILRAILDRVPGIRYSVSATTREPRADEIDGQHYYFISQEAFSRRVEAGDFLEYATVHNHSYGTPRRAVESALEEGMDLALDIDVQGGLRIKAQTPDAVLIFIMPPTPGVLAERLRGRATDSEEEVARRLKNAEKEMEIWSEYDYAVVNENLELAIEEVENIIRAERVKTARLRMVEP